MRKVLYLFISLLLAVTSCIERPEVTMHYLLKQAEGMVRTAPDTAFYFLQSLKETSIATGDDSVFLELLLLEAGAKNDATIPDTLAIHSLTSYYSAKADTLMLARTCRLSALAHRNLGDYEGTVARYNAAIALARPVEAKHVLADAYYELANVYYSEGLRTRTEPPRILADSLFYLTEQTAEELQDTALWINSLLSHSLIPEGRKQYAELERLLLLALRLSEKTCDTGHEAVAAMNLSMMYGELGEKEKSILYVRRNLDLRKGLIPDYMHYLVWGNAYQRIGEKDSAAYYLAKGKELKEKEKWTNFSVPSNHLTEEFELGSQSLEERLNQMRMNDEYKAQINRKQMALVISVSVLVVLGTVIILYLRKRHLRKETHLRKESAAEKQQLTQAHEQTKGLLQQTEEQLLKEREELQQKKEQLLLMQREIEALSADAGSVFDKIKHIVEDHHYKAASELCLEEADWQLLQLEMDKRWNHAVSRVQKEYRLTSNETHLLCLYLLEVPTSHIPYFFQRTVNTIYTWNRLLCAKLGISRSDNSIFKNEFKKFIENRG